MSKKGLMELCLSPDLGGLELYMVRAAKALDDDFRVLSVINQKGKLLPYFEGERYAVETVEKRSNFLSFSAARRIAELIDRHEIDIIHMHWTKDLPLAVLAKKLSRRRPALVQTRNMMMTRFKSDPYHRFLYQHMEMILPVTHQVAEQIETFVPEAIRPRIEVLYMGSDKPELLEEAEVARQREALGMAGQFVVGMVGRISEAKGQHLLIEALAKLKDPHIHAYFVGHEMKKGYIGELEALAQKRGVADRVHFLGFMKNPHHFYQMCDAVVLASRRETFGLVLIEAMQVGTAVIGSNSGGVVEIIDDQKSGLLFKQGSAASLAKAIMQYRADEPLRQQIAEAGLEKVQTHFSNALQFEKLGRLLETL